MPFKLEWLELHLAWPDVVPSVQERHGPVGAHPGEYHRNDLRDGTPLLRSQTERAGALQPGEKKAARWPQSSLSASNGEI